MTKHRYIRYWFTWNTNCRVYFTTTTYNTVEFPNKGHFGDNINSAVSSFVERLLSSRRFSMYLNYRKSNFLEPQAVSFMGRSNIHVQCPFLRGSTIAGSTVYAL